MGTARRLPRAPQPGGATASARISTAYYKRVAGAWLRTPVPLRRQPDGLRKSRTGLRLAANSGELTPPSVRFGFGRGPAWPTAAPPRARASASPGVQCLGATLFRCFAVSHGAASTRPPARAAANLTVRSSTGLYVLKRLLATSIVLHRAPGSCIRARSEQRIRQLPAGHRARGQSAIAICNGGSTTGYQRLAHGLAARRSVRACARAAIRAPRHLSRVADRAERRGEHASKITSLQVMLTVRLPTSR
jgi:hypothetical protein